MHCELLQKGITLSKEWIIEAAQTGSPHRNFLRSHPPPVVPVNSSVVCARMMERYPPL
jgi:hypothetical protein